MLASSQHQMSAGCRHYGVPSGTALYRFVPFLALSVPFLYHSVPFFVFFFFNYPHLKAIMAHVYRFVPFCTGFSIAKKTLSVISGICGELIGLLLAISN